MQKLLVLALMLALVLLSGLSVVVFYQQREIASLQAQPVGILASPSVAELSQENAVGSLAERDVYRQLRETCKNWQRWYQQDAAPVSLANRNKACKRVEKYAEDVLGIIPETTQAEVGMAAPVSAAGSRRSRAVFLSDNATQATDRVGSDHLSEADLQSLQWQLESLQKK